jgi:diguanylate cyclase
MHHPFLHKVWMRLQDLAAWTRQPELLVFLPALTLAGFWYGGEQVLVALAVGVPFLVAIAGAIRPGARQTSQLDTLSGLIQRPQLILAMDAILLAEAETGRTTACLVVLLDDADRLLDRHGRAAKTEVLSQCADRVIGALRGGDIMARIEGGGFAVALAPIRRIDLESMVQIATRLQEAVSVPISLDGLRVHVTASVGFCLSARAPEPAAAALFDAATLAAEDARRNGPAAIRAYAPDMTQKRANRDAFREELETALDTGQIVPYFQPQVSTETGAITGFEALARWHHPERGLVAPAEFLPLIEEAGLTERLGEVILYHALGALVRWDKAGFAVPAIGINFSGVELRNPKLVDKLKWELDRFELSPNRLSVEILESVVADTDHDVVVTNVAALSRLGCRIDLDDFGTGQAAIANIRRFAVSRLKIDRSFIARLDEDRAQQQMVSAILSMAEQLDLDTVAEGVETPRQHAILAQLGCGHVQGFGIARPMPFDDTPEWIRRQQTQAVTAMRISNQAR